MRHRLITILNTHTIRQTAVTALSTFISAGLGAVFYLLLARFLGSYEYGLFSLSLTLLMLLVTISDVGMAQGLIRFVGANRDSDKYLPYAALALRTKIIMGGLCWLALTLFAKPIAGIIFHQPELAKLLPITGLGIFSYLLISYSLSIFQAMQKFMLWGGLQVGSNALRLGLLAILLFLTKLNSHSAFMVFSLASLVGFATSWIWVDHQVLKSKIPVNVQTEFWKFNKWTAAFMILSSAVSRLDLVLTSRYVPLSQVGIYSLALVMVAFLPQLSTAIGAVTSSKFAGFKRLEDAKSYLVKATLLSSMVGLTVGAFMIPVSLMVIWFTGKDYSQAFVPFLILLLSLVIFMMGNPLRDFILYFSKDPKIFFWTSLWQGIVLCVFGLILIPKFGITGSAISVLGSHVFLGVVCLRHYLKHNT